jgi:hypothetical protein
MSFRHTQTVSSKGSFVGVCHAEMSYETNAVVRRRLKHIPDTKACKIAGKDHTGYDYLSLDANSLLALLTEIAEQFA